MNKTTFVGFGFLFMCSLYLIKITFITPNTNENIIGLIAAIFLGVLGVILLYLGKK